MSVACVTNGRYASVRLTFEDQEIFGQRAKVAREVISPISPEESIAPAENATRKVGHGNLARLC